MTELTSWPDVLRYLTAARRRYQVSGGMAVIDYEIGSKRSLVSLRPVRSSQARDASMWLALSVNVCGEREVVVRAALMANLAIPIGALGLHAEKLVLRQTLPLGGLLVTQLSLAMDALVRMAGDLYQPTLRADDPFGYLYR